MLILCIPRLIAVCCIPKLIAVFVTKVHGMEYFLPQQVCISSPPTVCVHVCSLFSYVVYPTDSTIHRQCLYSAGFKQAKRRRRAIGNEAYDQLVRDMETNPLKPCDELLAKFGIVSTYN